jgi:hypothetical protein
VDKNLLGELAKSKAICAFLLPFLAAVSSRFFRAEINAISDIEKTPLRMIKKRIIRISICLFIAFAYCLLLLILKRTTINYKP